MKKYNTLLTLAAEPEDVAVPKIAGQEDGSVRASDRIGDFRCSYFILHEESSVQSTLVLIKPDAIQRGLIGEILTRLERKGLKVTPLKMMRLDEALLNVHYSHLLQRPFFPEIRDFMAAAPVIAACIEGLDAVNTVRRLAGVTLAREADPGTIRGDFAMSDAGDVSERPSIPKCFLEYVASLEAPIAMGRSNSCRAGLSLA